MVKLVSAITFALLVIVAASLTADAKLVPMSWGFPVMTQNNTLTGLQSSMASASDIQSANIAFPTGVGGIFGSAFPTIGQNSQKNNLMTNLMFQSQTQNKLFAYPFMSIGGSPVPSMGFL